MACENIPTTLRKMDVTDITAQLDQLDGDFDKMEETVKPLIAKLSEIAAQLPLLDKAKLYVLAAYTIETALFSKRTPRHAPHTGLAMLMQASDALRLQGIDAKAHPIFTELTRVKQYFAKIKAAEEPPAQRTHTLDTQAVIRFIKADLARLLCTRFVWQWFEYWLIQFADGPARRQLQVEGAAGQGARKGRCEGRQGRKGKEAPC